MDYVLDSLGDRNFEHLAQALASKFVGQSVSVFGDGPDGGREASWDGAVDGSTRLPRDWVGYGVVQAKFKVKDTAVPADNADWLVKHMAGELDRWADPESKRRRRPDFLLVATNVTLSPGVDGGIERVEQAIRDRAATLGLELRGVSVWHRDEIRALLDDSLDIRSRYAAWITPGDVLQDLISQLKTLNPDFESAIRSYTAKVLRDGSGLNLTQAGSVGDAGLRVDQVFIDLPLESGTTAAAEIVRLGNSHRQADAPMRNMVLVGGPGQGKSTVTQFLSQVYRARFLEGHSVAAEHDIAEICGAVLERAEHSGVPAAAARRWPVRLLLTDLADQLADGQVSTLFGFLAKEVSRVSGYDLVDRDLREWLRAFPWLLMLDGLDEVPATSNRAEAVRVVKDFLLDAANLGGDVVVLVTTRPQGYNDEFGQMRFDHFELSALPASTALDYAKQLTRLRLGEESERFARVSRQLERAVSERETSRLMTSPLQVTILSLLVERQGQAPKDRWRLFSQYYRVIYQREQEKGGELADILGEYESDIHAVHYAAGFVLQTRSELAGDSESVLSSTELIALLESRLREQGHEPLHAERLARLIQLVATDRLVFLAEVRAGAFGFEIRSLQEFMAAEQIIESPPSQVISSLRSIALSSYWSNVLMFAIGKIFAEREAFRADVTTLCDLLNSDSVALGAVRQGDVLAARIIEEGVARSSPMFEKVLAHKAASLLEIGPGEEVAVLAATSTSSREAAISPCVSDLLAQGKAETLALAQYFAIRVDAGSELERESLQQHLASIHDDSQQRQVLRLATTFRSPVLEKESAVYALRHAPEILLADDLVGRDTRRAPEFDVDSKGRRNLIDRLLESVGGSDGEDSVVLHDSPRLSAMLGPLTSADHELAPIVELETTHQSWKALQGALRFSLDPSRETLRAALPDLVGETDRLVRRVVNHAPWPLGVAIEYLNWHNRPGSGRQAMGSIQDADFGDLETWASVQAFRGSLDPDRVWNMLWSVMSKDTTPEIGSALTSPDAFTVACRRFRVTYADSESSGQALAWADETFARLRQLPDSVEKSATARMLLFFATAVGAREPGSVVLPEDGQPESGPEFDVDAVLDAVASAAAAGWNSPNWLTLLSEDCLHDPRVRAALVNLGSDPGGGMHDRRGGDNGKLERSVDAALTEDAVQFWPMARISFLCGGLPKVDSLVQVDVDDAAYRSIVAALTLISSSSVLAAADLGDIAANLYSSGDHLVSADAVNLWSVLRHPMLLEGVASENDPKAANLAALAVAVRELDPVWAAEARRRLRSVLESMPARHSDVPGLHKRTLGSTSP